jgi:hypothetical protein
MSSKSSEYAVKTAICSKVCSSSSGVLLSANDEKASMCAILKSFKAISREGGKKEARKAQGISEDG